MMCFMHMLRIWQEFNTQSIKKNWKENNLATSMFDEWIENYYEIPGCCRHVHKQKQFISHNSSSVTHGKY